MVFGWGTKKSKESGKPAGLQRQVALVEISEILKEKENERLPKLAEKAKEIRDRVDIERKNIIQIVSQLESDDLKADNVDKHLKMLIERSKKAVISGLRKETSINFSKTAKYSEIVNLNTEIGQMLKRIGDILGVNTKVMHIFARKYTDKLKHHIAQVATTKAGLQKIVDEHSAYESSVASILDWREKIKSSKSEIEDKNRRLAETKLEIENYTKTIQIQQQEINNLKSKREYQEYLNIKKEIESFQPEQDKIKYEINLQFSKISRPLGKYSYVSALDKPIKKIMESLIENPADTITQENKDSIIEILQAVVKGVVSGNVSVKDSEKSTEQVEETITRLDEFLRMKENLSQKRRAFEDKLGIFNIKDLEQKEEILAKTIDAKSHAEPSIKTLEKEIEDATKRIPQLTKDIETKLGEILGSKITLAVQD